FASVHEDSTTPARTTSIRRISTIARRGKSEPLPLGSASVGGWPSTFLLADRTTRLSLKEAPDRSGRVTGCWTTDILAQQIVPRQVLASSARQHSSTSSGLRAPIHPLRP